MLFPSIIDEKKDRQVGCAVKVDVEGRGAQHEDADGTLVARQGLRPG
jgi:hypothetical protein